MISSQTISTVLFISLTAVVALRANEEASAPLSETSAAKKAGFAATLPVEQAILTSAPHVPPPITRRHPARVVVDLEVKEIVRKLADGVEYSCWTFGGEVPGLFIRVRQGDLVEFHLHNHPSSKLPHNIDLHAVTGPGGGAASSLTAPGHSSVFSFQALNPGLFVYHCATAPVPLHIANGMYGLILVEPYGGLPAVNREYYLMQSEFYTAGKFGEAGTQAFDMDKALDEKPSYVVFNGAANSLTGDKAITASVGETVRLFVGNGGPNLTSSFHVIGEIFDRVYQEGGTVGNQSNVQTTLVPPGGSSMVEFLVDVPGTYVLVDHAIFRAFNKGALGLLKVTGPDNPIIYSGKEADELYSGELPLSARRAMAALPPPAAPKPAPEVDAGGPATPEVRFERGKKIFSTACFACHGLEGQGVPGVFPPLAGSDYLAADKERQVRILTKGLTGPVVVNGVTYNNVMPPQEFTDEQVTDVLHYVNNAFGNKNGSLSVEDVKRLRAALK